MPGFDGCDKCDEHDDHPVNQDHHGNPENQSW
jgi:hypothetical protein